MKVLQNLELQHNRLLDALMEDNPQLNIGGVKGKFGVLPNGALGYIANYESGTPIINELKELHIDPDDLTGVLTIDRTQDNRDYIILNIEALRTLLGLNKEKSKIIVEADPNPFTINWQTDIATDSDGNPSTDLTWADKYGTTPIIQVALEISPGHFQVRTVPINIFMTTDPESEGIETIEINLSGLPSEITIS